MSSEIPESLSKLRLFCIFINNDMKQSNSVDWSDMELLVEQLNTLVPTHPILLPLKDIIHYEEENSEWDSGACAEWPNLILNLINYHFGVKEDWQVATIQVGSHKALYLNGCNVTIAEPNDSSITENELIGIAEALSRIHECELTELVYTPVEYTEEWEWHEAERHFTDLGKLYDPLNHPTS